MVTAIVRLLEKMHDSFFIPRTRNVNTMKHLKAGNVCRAARGCPFGKKDGRPFVCAAAQVCCEYTGMDKQADEDRETVPDAGEG